MNAKWVKLSDISEVILSNVDKKSKKGQAAIKLCNFTDVYNNWAINKKTAVSFMSATASKADINKLRLQKGQVAITKDSETRKDIGMSAYIADDMENVFLGYHCALIKPNVDLLNGKYLNAFLSSYLGRRYFSNQASGSGQRYTLTFESIADTKIPIIDITDQKHIGELFSLIDRKMENNVIIFQKLVEIAKTIFNYWFLQFEFPDKYGKPYNSSGGKMIWNNQLKQEIPEGWEVSSVKDILGKYPRTGTIKTENYNQKGIYPIVDQSKNTYICGYTDNKEKVLNMKDAVVFGDHSNKSKYVNFPFARGADGTQILNSNTSRLPNYLLYQEIISLPEIEKGYSRHFKFLKMQNVVIPTLDVAQKYMDAVKDMLAYQRQIVIENKELKSLRDFLLPLLINGQVSINS